MCGMCALHTCCCFRSVPNARLLFSKARDVQYQGGHSAQWRRSRAGTLAAAWRSVHICALCLSMEQRDAVITPLCAHSGGANAFLYVRRTAISRASGVPQQGEPGAESDGGSKRMAIWKQQSIDAGRQPSQSLPPDCVQWCAVGAEGGKPLWGHLPGWAGKTVAPKQRAAAALFGEASASGWRCTQMASQTAPAWRVHSTTHGMQPAGERTAQPLLLFLKQEPGHAQGRYAPCPGLCWRSQRGQ
ncbi:hypothetical protein GQ54DRAFT_22441 [Martensiomyces pterosporus]|nr:hypothetical protein GQ54DRAFT_22441 [Martensiomyces pterosporus]